MASGALVPLLAYTSQGRRLVFNNLSPASGEKLAPWVVGEVNVGLLWQETELTLTQKLYLIFPDSLSLTCGDFPALWNVGPYHQGEWIT